MNKELFEKGLKVRKEVLGDEYVEESMANATPYTKMVQELTTEYCWGTVWTRPGLERKTRSLINVSMITALNRPNELRLHVRGALRNGCTKDEITEALYQATIYCGVPAGIDSFKIAQEVFDSFDE